MNPPLAGPFEGHAKRWDKKIMNRWAKTGFGWLLIGLSGLGLVGILAHVLFQDLHRVI